MKPLLDFLPVVLFFITYKLSDMIMATAVLMAAICIQMAIIWFKKRTLDNTQKFTLLAILIFGGLTLAFRDESFIKWKVTAVNGMFGLAFLVMPLFGKKEPLVKKMLGAHFDMPTRTWSRLNVAYALFFIGCAALNVVVFKTMSDDAWVNFKLFGLMGLMLVFMVVQFYFLKDFLRPMEEDAQKGDPVTTNAGTKTDPTSELVEKAAEITAVVESE